MKKILIAAAAIATVAGASSVASAQDYRYGGDHRPGYGQGYGDHRPGYRRGHDINARQDALSVRIQRGERNGRLNRWEARQLRGELYEIHRMEHRFRVSGGRLDRREYAILDARLDRLEFRVMAEMRDGRRYGDGYGRDYDHDHRY